MKFERPKSRELERKDFEVGVHVAHIYSIDKQKSGKGNDMFVLTIEGQNGEQVRNYMAFGTPYSELNLSYLLASIQDNGVDIPDIEFGYNPETLKFLLKKSVYIEIEPNEYEGTIRYQLKTFLTQEEFENGGSEATTKDATDANDDW